MSVLVRPGPAIILLCLLLVGIIVACGEEATSTAAPETAAPAATQAPAEATQAPAATAAAAPTQAPAPAVSTPTPAAAPTPAATPPPSTGPVGTLNVAVNDFASPVFVLHNQPFVEARYDNIVTHETMFAGDPNGEVVSRLVTEWNLSPDGLVSTFTLRQGVQWHDQYGDWGDFSADDFIWSFDDVTLPASPHASAGNIRRVFKCEECSLTKVDDYTVQLTRPSPSFEIDWHSRAPSPTAMAFHSKVHYDTVGEDTATTLQSVGTGPWQLVEIRAGDIKRVEAVSDHWRKAPEFEEMVWFEFTEQSTMLANFLTGELDAGQFDLDTIQAIRGENNPDYKFMVFPGGSEVTVHLLGQHYNSDHPHHNPDAEGNIRVPLGEDSYDCSYPWVSCDRDVNSEEWEKARKVRLALSLAIDRQKLVNNIAQGEGEPHYIREWLGQDVRMRQFDLDKVKVDFDLDRAKQLMAEAGYPNGFETNATLTPGTGEIVTQAVATMWEELGVKTSQERMPYSAFRPNLVNRTGKGMWTQAFPPSDFEPMDRYNILHSSKGALTFGFEHPDFQALLEEANMLIDPDARWGKQAEMGKWIFDQTMVLSVYGENIVWPLGPKVDTWDPLAGNKNWLSNWEYAHQRQ